MSAGALGQVAGWETGPARGAVVTLAGAADRLPPWRSRVEAVGRALGAPGCWSGPAASVAAAAVAELSAVAVALGEHLRTSLEQLQRTLVHGDVAQLLAARALALAADAGVGLLPDGSPDALPAAATPATAPDQAQVLRERIRTASLAAALAEEALAEAALAGNAAAAAKAALPPPAALHPVDAPGSLVTGLAGTPVPPVPAAAAPQEVGAWWAALALPAQLAAVRGCPQLVGGLDGVPAWARDRANRELLRRALTAPEGPGSAAARTVSGALAAEEERGDPVQLLEFDVSTGRAAVVLGDLDAATEVGVLVPGMGTTVTGGLGPLLADARGVRDAALAATPGTPAATVATVAWLGYRAPRSIAEADSALDARRGGVLLDRTLAGLSASRAAAGLGLTRTTVLAHSYGTLVAGEAARRPGRLAADAVVLMGSPGMGLRGAASLEAPEVYAAGSLGDPVSYLGRFGVEPTVPWYGATRLPTDTWETHGSYYDPRHPTLAALGRVVAGTQQHR